MNSTLEQQQCSWPAHPLDHGQGISVHSASQAGGRLRAMRANSQHIMQQVAAAKRKLSHTHTRMQPSHVRLVGWLSARPPACLLACLPARSPTPRLICLPLCCNASHDEQADGRASDLARAISWDATRRRFSSPAVAVTQLQQLALRERACAYKTEPRRRTADKQQQHWEDLA